MRVLLVKPRPAAVQFGLAPFFQTEPLGLEYIASALSPAGHETRIVDFRFERRSIERILSAFPPRVVGIACLHILDAPATIDLARRIKRAAPSTCVAVGGHAAGAYPRAFDGVNEIDLIAGGEGEEVTANVCRAVEYGLPLDDIPSLLLRDSDGVFRSIGDAPAAIELASVRPPNRALVEHYQNQYCCLNYMPVWTIETARGCPHRCKFCSVWQFHHGVCRFHSLGNVRSDFENTGPNVFIVDDLFWGNLARSEELADVLLASSGRKRWILAQSRVDTVSQNPDLLQRWRPLARNFDIFFGFESPTREGLRSLHKGFDPARTTEAVRVARELGFGVTGNFIIDPDYTEDDFRCLWDFLEQQQLFRVGFTILTPLPGTQFFEDIRSKVAVLDWNQFDLHHLLWRPRLPLRRFFELYCETWKRTVLNAAGRKKWWQWLREVELRKAARMMRILARTQKLMDPEVYVAETRLPPHEVRSDTDGPAVLG